MAKCCHEDEEKVGGQGAGCRADADAKGADACCDDKHGQRADACCTDAKDAQSCCADGHGDDCCGADEGADHGAADCCGGDDRGKADGSCCGDDSGADCCCDDRGKGVDSCCADGHGGDSCRAPGARGGLGAHTRLIDDCSLTRWQMALLTGGVEFAWYALPDLVRSRALRGLLKTGMVAGGVALGLKHCEIEPQDLATGRAAALARESVSNADGDVDCTGRPKRPAPDEEPVGVTPDGRPLLGKLTDRDAPGKKPGEPCGCGGKCGCGGDEDAAGRSAAPTAASATGCACADGVDAAAADSCGCPAVWTHERVKDLFAGNLRRGWPVLAAGAGVLALAGAIEAAVYRFGCARARGGARWPHVTNGLVIGALNAAGCLALDYWGERDGKGRQDADNDRDRAEAAD